MSAGRYKPYPKYKDSGVEWLGEIPGHWQAKRLKFVASEPIKNGIGEAGAYDDPEWPRYVRITDIFGPRGLRDDTFKSLPPELAKEARFQVGDILLAAVGATFGKSYFHVEDVGEACFAGYLVRFSPGREVESSYAGYWTESSAYWALVQSRVVQSTIQNFSAAKYKELSLPLPSAPEQRAIAAFLDRETGRIDGLVAKKEQLCVLLREKRTALITHAVTKGLDPNVPMKDSGVEWLGEIPAEWEVKPLRWALTIRSGEALPNTEFELMPSDERDVPVIGGNGVMGYADRSNTLAPCIAVGRVGALCGNVHLVDPPAWVTDNALVLTEIRGFDRQYLAPLFHALDLNRWASQNAQPLITGGFVKARRVCRPPLAEQRAIAAFLDRETARIDALVAKVREAVERLKELRTALISAAVTGKIDVREEVAA